VVFAPARRALRAAFDLRSSTPAEALPASPDWQPLPARGNYTQYEGYPAGAVELFAQVRFSYNRTTPSARGFCLTASPTNALPYTLNAFPAATETPGFYLAASYKRLALDAKP
jgi:hypothetical protein